MKKEVRRKEEIAEDYCFICKDGGLLRVCDYKHCLKAYHSECVGKDSAFLETDNRWTCGWHSCFLCHKSSKFQCFCCPYSICQPCTRVAAFVHVKKGKGFCSNCLRIALLIEENLDIDSDGGKVDFKDSETYEFLFKEYWDLIKQQEDLSLEDLHTADSLLKKAEVSVCVSNSDHLLEVGHDVTYDVGKMEPQIINETSFIKKYAGKDVWVKTGRKRYMPRKEEFLGWGSKKLLGFLTSIGKNVDESISQDEVYDIIKEYIQENNLIHPRKKRKVICDENLHYLFGRKSLNRLKISTLLESHFAENKDSEDDYLYGSDEEDVTVSCKRQRRPNSDEKSHSIASNEFIGKVLEFTKNCYASITMKNIKLAYLKRCLIEEFLKTPETFEAKVLDCFVRVRSDPNGYFLPKNYFQLMQVTGTKRASETYRVGEISTDIVLHVSNITKDIRICMVSDDDFSEEECADLCKRMKAGLLKRPTVAELDKKARSLHEDITNHWIDQEIMTLQNLIDRANEKGWRRELFEYIERKELLENPSERLRLLKEMPKIIPDEEEKKIEGCPNSCIDAGVKEGNEALANQKELETPASWMELEASLNRMDSEVSVSQMEQEIEKKAGKGAIFPKLAGKIGTEDSTNSISSFFFGNEIASNEKIVESEPKGDVDIINGKAAESEAEGIGSASIVSRPQDSGNVDVINEKSSEAEREDEGIGSGAASTASRQQENEEQQQQQSARIKDAWKQNDVIDIDDDEVPHVAGGTREMNSMVISVIDIDDDDGDGNEGGDPCDITRTVAKTSLRANEEKRPVDLSAESLKLWHYMDPSGKIQGPFAMSYLRLWKEIGYFDADFKVWESGKSKQDAILLTEALGL